MKKCTKCVMPETKPGISFNKKGVCNACQNAELKKKVINYKTRMKELYELAAKIKKQKPEGYNCVVAVSGGKDSTFLAMTARDKLGLTPLCVNVKPVEATKLGQENIKNLSKLGFDIFRFIPNYKIMPTLVKRSFIEDGDPATSHEFMLYSVPVRVAMNYKIPLVIWGENAVFEYGNIGKSPESSAAEQKHNVGLKGRDADYWICKGVTKKDLVSFQHPTKEEIEKAGVTAIYLSYYVDWDSRKIAKFSIKHGLTIRPRSELLGSGGYWDFEQLDDETPVVSHLLKYIKFGYGRATDHACRDIRAGYITREQGLKLVEKYDGRLNLEYVKNFCKQIGITIKEFWDIADTFRNKRFTYKRTLNNDVIRVIAKEK